MQRTLEKNSTFFAKVSRLLVIRSCKYKMTIKMMLVMMEEETWTKMN